MKVLAPKAEHRIGLAIIATLVFLIVVSYVTMQPGQYGHYLCATTDAYGLSRCIIQPWFAHACWAAMWGAIGAFVAAALVVGARLAFAER